MAAREASGAGAPDEPRWWLVVPVKRLDRAKSRLAPLPAPLRARLAAAMALDTVAAALRCDRVAGVLVVTDERDLAEAALALGAAVEPDRPDAGLNAALAHGLGVAARAATGSGTGVLSADLPALRPAELGRALADAARHPRAFVRDAGGDGSTLLVGGPGEVVVPRFGAGSADAHRADGAVEVGEDLASLRRDVDTVDDLAAARLLGVGPHTRAVLGSEASLAVVQATVRTFDPDRRDGTVLLDDGVELPFDATAFDASGLRLLRFGQRVRIEVTGSGGRRRVTALTIVTLRG